MLSTQYAQYSKKAIMIFFMVFTVIKILRWWLWSKRENIFKDCEKG